MEEVTGVQARLANLGFSPGPVDGIQGELTAGAIRRFQRAYGLTVDGIAGPQTRAKLKEVHGC
jgi:peptidoglycan hydrolase-like protein with peptidoglycan-binding domain